MTKILFIGKSESFIPEIQKMVLPESIIEVKLKVAEKLLKQKAWVKYTEKAMEEKAWLSPKKAKQIKKKEETK